VFCLESVFSKTSGWVSRRLLPKEVAPAWDIPPDRLAKWEVDLLFGKSTLSQVIKQPPLKIIQCAFASMLGDTPAVESYGHNKSVLIDSAFKLSTLIPATMLTEVKSFYAKAVKSDDAAMESAMLDTACVEEFDPETHSPILKALRKYSVVRFVKNVKASFVKYLISKYEFTWTQELEAALDKESDLLKKAETVSKGP
jgi:hypothetical protein